MNKKAQGISINVIIIASIALLVLVILAVLLIRSGEYESDIVDLDETVITEIYVEDFDSLGIDCHELEVMILADKYPLYLYKEIKIYKNEAEEMIGRDVSKFNSQDFIDYYFNNCVIDKKVDYHEWD